MSIPSATISSDGARLPSSIFSNVFSLAPASTMTISISLFSLSFPAMTISKIESSCSVFVACTTHSSLMRDILTAPTGDSNGIPASCKPSEAALRDKTSYSFSLSTLKTVAIICVSHLKPSLKEGLSGLSINRHAKIAFSVCLPSLLKNPPGILPAAYILSSTSTVKGKKSIPSLTDSFATVVTSTFVSPDVTTTEPGAWRANLPVSNLISLSPILHVTFVTDIYPHFQDEVINCQLSLKALN